MLLKARWIFPVSSPPIENGAVVVDGDRIVFVGEAALGRIQDSPLHQTIIDLGNAILLPGLVDAHCHLEHSALKGLTTPGQGFTAWVRELARQSAALTKGDVRVGAKHGLEALIRGGTTTVADHASPESDPIETPLRRIPFWEVLGAHEGRAKLSLEAARQRAREEGGYVSPHSLYAVHEEVLEKSPLHSLHMLESADEDRFFRTQDGPLAVYVQERGGDLAFPFSSPVQWLAANHGLTRDGRTLGSPLLLIHGNYLNPSEIGALRGTGAFVIHCPGSHLFFSHKAFPLEQLRDAGIPVALGTDSLASNEDLSMLREMRLMKESCPTLSDEDILKMATIEGARALGMEKEIGSIEIGKKADLVAVRVGAHGHAPVQDVMNADQIYFSMIDGKVVLNHV